MARRNIKFLVNDVKEATVKAARTACVDIMNSLVQEGPAWTGKFSSAWYAVPSGASAGGARSDGSLYKYDLRNVPASRFKAGTMYGIINGMDYAGQAMDLEPFELDDDIPPDAIKPIERGTRPAGGMRGELIEGSGNRRTAPLDWYSTYVNGGSLNHDLGRGARRGFGTYKPKGFGK